MSYIKIGCSREELSEVVKSLRLAGYRLGVIERDSMSDTVKIEFRTSLDANVKTIIQQAIRQSRLNGLSDFDELNILQYTPAQVANYIENNVTNLAQAKAVLKALAKLNLYLLRRLAKDI